MKKRRETKWEKAAWATANALRVDLASRNEKIQQLERQLRRAGEMRAHFQGLAQAAQQGLHSAAKLLAKGMREEKDEGPTFALRKAEVAEFLANYVANLPLEGVVEDRVFEFDEKANEWTQKMKVKNMSVWTSVSDEPGKKL